MAKKPKIRTRSPQRLQLFIEAPTSTAPYADVLRFAQDRKAEHGTLANAICVAVRQSDNFKSWAKGRYGQRGGQ